MSGVGFQLSTTRCPPVPGRRLSALFATRAGEVRTLKLPHVRPPCYSIGMAKTVESDAWDTPIRYVKGVGESRAALLERLAIADGGGFASDAPSSL